MTLPIDIPEAPHTTHSFMPDGQCRYKGCNAILAGPYIRSNIKRILDKANEPEAPKDANQTYACEHGHNKSQCPYHAADTSLGKRTEHSATDSEATTDDASLPSSSDTLNTILLELSGYSEVVPGGVVEKAKQQIKDWAYQETLNLIGPVPAEEERWRYTNEPAGRIQLQLELIAKAATKWGQS